MTYEPDTTVLLRLDGELVRARVVGGGTKNVRVRQEDNTKYHPAGMIWKVPHSWVTVLT